MGDLLANFDPTTLALAIAFGIVGLGYFFYGKRNSFIFAFAGIGLMVLPYMTHDLTYLIWSGLGLVIGPFILRRFID